jgi:hypothetical protein
LTLSVPQGVKMPSFNAFVVSAFESVDERERLEGKKKETLLIRPGGPPSMEHQQAFDNPSLVVEDPPFPIGHQPHSS